ncbi:hypothetical protein DYB36_010382, partial [Aphanomyces astaci]
MSEEALHVVLPVLQWLAEGFFDPRVFGTVAISVFLYKLLPTTDPVLGLGQVKKPRFQARSHVFATDLVRVPHQRDPAMDLSMYAYAMSRVKKIVVGSNTGPDGKTPVSGNVTGRQVWRPQGDVVELPAFSAAENPNAGDKLLRKLLLDGKKVPTGGNGGKIDKALRQALEYFKLLQVRLVITCYITGHDLGQSIVDGIIVYLRNQQQYDGGWGLHIEEGSSMFGTVLNYVSLRLLGVPPTDDVCVDARTFILHHGGATLVPSWGKVWLALLNVYDWRGVDSLPPEMWLLPRWLPFHPGRTWVHCRMVYLPMSYLYGIRFQAAETPLIVAIRGEIYATPYKLVSWRKARGAYSKLDEYHAPSPIIRTINYLLSWYELLPTLLPYRKRGLEFALDFIQADDNETNFCNIGPVNKSLNMLVAWVVNPNSNEFKQHTQRIEDYLWVAEDGVKMQGYVGSQTWDASFAIQAFVEAGVATDAAFKPTFVKAQSFLTEAQNVHDVDDGPKWWRRYMIYCTAEAVKALLLLQQDAKLPAFPEQRLKDAIDFILALQNTDGGFPPYERSRGFDWYEYLNPAVVFGAIMHDYSYVECSSASISALQAFQAAHPTYRPHAISAATAKADTFIRSLQYQDGSFFGKWGVCHTYGTLFAIKGYVRL